MKPELEELLQHHGVKGMKWGEHKARLSSTVKTHVSSIKREHNWNKVLKKAHSMSTKDIQRHAARAQLENDLKRLSNKSNVGSAKDKKDYLQRANMSDQELFRKVQRLRAKESLHRTSNDATRKQRELGKKVIQIAAPIAIQYALTKSINKKDVFNTIRNPHGAKAKAINSLLEKASKIPLKR